MKKVIIFFVVVLLFIAGYFAYNQYTIMKNNTDERISINSIQGLDDIKNIDTNINGFAIISMEDALQLASEQIDLSNFAISASNNIYRESSSSV